jgi:hypothetical protein
MVSKEIKPTTALLEAGGFVHAGAWRLDESSGLIRFEGVEPLPRESGVYAFAVGGVVHYVGSAQRGLHRRFRNYAIAKTLKTARRIRLEILAQLTKGEEVEVFTMVPPPMSLNVVLPVDPVAGLEEGLIRSMQPAWNRRGKRKGA